MYADPLPIMILLSLADLLGSRSICLGKRCRRTLDRVDVVADMIHFDAFQCRTHRTSPACLGLSLSLLTAVCIPFSISRRKHSGLVLHHGVRFMRCICQRRLACDLVAERAARKSFREGR